MIRSAGALAIAANATSRATEYQARSNPSINDVQETGLVPARTEHPRVEEQRVLVRKQLGESHALANFPVVGPLKEVVLLQLSAGRELAALFRNRSHFVDMLLLLLEQGIARAPRDARLSFG
jgi:hypothetical protein